jgi:PKD repeat protein
MTLIKATISEEVDHMHIWAQGGSIPAIVKGFIMLANVTEGSPPICNSATLIAETNIVTIPVGKPTTPPTAPIEVPLVTPVSIVAGNWYAVGVQLDPNTDMNLRHQGVTWNSTNTYKLFDDWSDALKTSFVNPETPQDNVTYQNECIAAVALGPPPQSGPTAAFTISPPIGLINEQVTYDGSLSKDGWTGSAVAPIVSWDWEFGDGATGSGKVTTHTYTQEGTYTVRLTVTDSQELTDFMTVLLTVQATPVQAQYKRKSELRGVLVKFLTQYAHDDDLICQTLASYGFNALYLELYPFFWTGNSLNQFQEMIDACKKYGLEFHVLFAFYGYDPSYTDASESGNPYGLEGSDPDWRMVDANGNYVNWCCLQRASTRARVKQVIETMLTWFPDIVDINLDYIRYPTSSEGIDQYSICYCNECKAAFQGWLAINGKTFTGNWADYYHGGSHWLEYAEWRCEPINNMVRDVRQWALLVNSNLMFTADVWSTYVGWTPDTYKEYMGQDPAYWISKGWLDAINPMKYTDDISSLQRLQDEIQYQTGDAKGAVPLVPFITPGSPGSGVSPVSTSFWVQEIDYLRSIGCNGFIIWRYCGPGFSETGTTLDITPYLAAIRDSCTKGAFPVFTQSQPSIAGSLVTWLTSLPTTGKVEYSQTPIFTATPKTGSLLPYVDIDYVPGTILSESTPRTNHAISVPGPPPSYVRIRDEDTNIELATLMYSQQPGIYHSLQISVAGIGGTTSPDPGNYNITEGQSITVTAIATVDYKFLYWLRDGVQLTDNPIMIIMDADHTLEAFFEYVPPPPLTATISGVVKDSVTNIPIPAATVTCDGYADITETDGTYTFSGIPAQVYTLKITKEGFQTKTISVDLSAGGTFTEDVTLSPKPAPITSSMLPAALGLLAVAGILYLATRKKR